MLSFNDFVSLWEKKIGKTLEKTLISQKINLSRKSMGDIYDHNSLVEAIKKVDVVISSVGMEQIADQTKIIAAIKEAGNIKRFLPSEFGTDVDHIHPVEPAGTFFRNKSNIRRAIEAEGISYTFVVSYGFAGYMLPSVGDSNAKVPPKEKVKILGDGNCKGVFVEEENIAT
ncbi:isoflavone reductase-like protein [Morus notabilis]|uniref:isoflavone reductase-like protein n=1 Tax=Morus notabilis TaxID=981085 RepID=UPI000CECFDE1|nr:isoflavone reductase-like protein [Morus notabilis]